MDLLTEKVDREGTHAEETRNDGRLETKVENVRLCVLAWSERQGAFNGNAFLGGF